MRLDPTRLDATKRRELASFAGWLLDQLGA